MGQALWERVGRGKYKANSNTLIRSATTFSQGEKEFCKLPKERRGFASCLKREKEF
jgi:hypothetical protein